MRYTVVVPVTGATNPAGLLRTLEAAEGPPPVEVLIVETSPHGTPPPLPTTRLAVRTLPATTSGPAAAWNLGWRAGKTEWIVFLDENILIGRDWPHRLHTDLRTLPSDCTTSIGHAQAFGLPTTDSNDTGPPRDRSAWSTADPTDADLAYRRSVLLSLGGFEERFRCRRPAVLDLSLRIRKAGYREEHGLRSTTFAPRNGGIRTALHSQQEHADAAVLRARHGRYWRRETGQPRSRIGRHTATLTAGAAGVGLLARGHRSTAALAAGAWAGLTGGLVRERIRATTSRTVRDVTSTLVESVLTPPTATVQSLRGRLRAQSPAAVLLDRDNTLIEDVPYLADPQQVQPMPGAEQALAALREDGVQLGIVTNQSGLARGYFTAAQLAAVHTRVDELLGPFHTWQVCPHGPDEGCLCRKPAPGMVRRANAVLGVLEHRCVVIGDIGSDVQAAQAAGAHAILVPTPRTLSREVEHARSHARLAADLPEAARIAQELL